MPLLSFLLSCDLLVGCEVVWGVSRYSLGRGFWGFDGCGGVRVYSMGVDLSGWVGLLESVVGGFDD